MAPYVVQTCMMLANGLYPSKETRDSMMDKSLAAVSGWSMGYRRVSGIPSELVVHGGDIVGIDDPCLPDYPDGTNAPHHLYDLTHAQGDASLTLASRTSAIALRFTPEGGSEWGAEILPVYKPAVEAGCTPGRSVLYAKIFELLNNPRFLAMSKAELIELAVHDS